MSLKPLSDLERAMLAAIGEDPNTHQQRIAKRAQGIKLTEDKPAKLGNFLLQQTQTKANDKGEPTPAERVAAIKEPTAFRWLPECYTLFRVKATCKCGAQHVYPEGPYLCEKRVHGTQDDPSHPRRYLPIRGIEYPRLPARTQIIFRALTFCESCWRQGAHIIPELTCDESAKQSNPAHTGPSPTFPPGHTTQLENASDSPCEPSSTLSSSESAAASDDGQTSQANSPAECAPSSGGDSSASASVTSAFASACRSLIAIGPLVIHSVLNKEMANAPA